MRLFSQVGFVFGFVLIFGQPEVRADFFYGKTVNQDSPDITVISARFGSRVAFALNPANAFGYDLLLDGCNKLPSGLGFLFDCTQDLVSKTSLPAMMPVRLVEGAGFNCALLTVTTVTREDAYNVASGIGFYSTSDRALGVRKESRLIPIKQNAFVPMKRLAKNNGVFTLKNGERAVQNVFVGLGACDQDENLSRKWPIEFKPYLQIDAPNEGRDGTRYMNWDAHGNYSVTLANPLDRTTEVLK